jgi:hypothetical protein
MSSIVEEIVSEARAADDAARTLYLEIIGRAAADVTDPADAKRVRELLVKLDLTPDDLQADIEAVRQASTATASIIDAAEVDRLREVAGAANRAVLATVDRHFTELRQADAAGATAGAAYRRAASVNTQVREAVAKLRQSHPRAFGLPTPAK